MSIFKVLFGNIVQLPLINDLYQMDKLLRYCQCFDGNTESYLYDTYEWGNRKRCKRIPENQILIVDFV